MRNLALIVVEDQRCEDILSKGFGFFKRLICMKILNRHRSGANLK